MSDRNRAIDALLAERAMGWKWYQFGKSRFLRPDGSWATLNKQLADMTEDTPDDTGYPQGQFSTDPAASKQLRDKMRDLGWSYDTGFARGYGYAAEFMMLPESSGAAGANTEELAVALAVLAALGIEAPK